MFSVPSNFIADFKTGDNIAFNLRILTHLYDTYSAGTPDKKILLRKLIIIELVSSIEAILYDFHFRVRSFKAEGIDGLASSVIDYIRGKTIEEFEKCITSARKHDLFNRSHTSFYLELDELRRLFVVRTFETVWTSI